MTEHEDPIAEALEDHVPLEVIFGYPVEPGESVEEGYVETCMCGEKYPCVAVRLVNALKKVTAERDALAAVVHYLRLLTDGSDWNGGQVDDILNSAPSVALDRVKAEAWDEGHKAMSLGQIENPYRKGESNE